MANAEPIGGIKINPGQTPYGPKDFKIQSSANSASGPWVDVYTGSMAWCATVGSCSEEFTWPAQQKPYWRLFVLSSQSGTNRIKVMDVDFSICS